MKTYKQKLAYTAFGGILMLMGILASSVLMPSLFAERAKLGDIECTSLRVVDAEGTTRILLLPSLDNMSNLMEVVDVMTTRGVIIGVNKHGGRVGVAGNNGTSSVIAAIDDDGRAGVTMIDKNGNLPLFTDIFEE